MKYQNFSRVRRVRWKISFFHKCVAKVKILIFSPHEMNYIWFLPKKSIQRKTQKAKPNFFSGRFSFIFFSVFIGYKIWCKHSLHLENGLESYFNEWNARNQHLKKVNWMCLRICVTCKLALRQVKQWRLYVWCWRLSMCSVISDKYPMRYFFTVEKYQFSFLICIEFTACVNIKQIIY